MKRKKRFFWALVLLCAAGLLAGGSQLLQMSGQRRAGEEFYSSLRLQASAAPAGAEPGRGPAPQEEPEQPAAEEASFWEENPQAVAWLSCPGTSLDFPVAQGEDNDFYLSHLLDGSPHRYGCPFLDQGNAADFSDRNSIVYGHHMVGGAMFAPLTQYQSQAYYEAHPTLRLSTPEAAYTVELFAGYPADPQEDASPWQQVFLTEEEFSAWARRAAERSCLESGVLPGPGDRVLTLSTCETPSGTLRFVLHGILREEKAEE